MTTPTALLVMPDTILSVPLLVADRPRAIDEVIDYFGDPPRSDDPRGPRAIVPSENW